MCMLAAAANITAMDQILLPDSRISIHTFASIEAPLFSTQKPKFVSPKMGYPKKNNVCEFSYWNHLVNHRVFHICPIVTMFFPIEITILGRKKSPVPSPFPQLKSPPPGTMPSSKAALVAFKASFKRSSAVRCPKRGEKLGKTQEICLFYPIEWRWTIVFLYLFPWKNTIYLSKCRFKQVWDCLSFRVEQPYQKCWDIGVGSWYPLFTSPTWTTKDTKDWGISNQISYKKHESPKQQQMGFWVTTKSSKHNNYCNQ